MLENVVIDLETMVKRDHVLSFDNIEKEFIFLYVFILFLCDFYNFFIESLSNVTRFI